MTAAGTFDHAILFTGHMIDAPGRKIARFPASAEEAAQTEIHRSIEALLIEGRRLVGIAGGASGGDLLFHEACAQLGIATQLRLALPVEQYIAASVSPAGEGWVRRFRTLMEGLGPDGVRVLDQTVVLPRWLTGGADLDVWQRVNLWMVDETIAIAPRRTLIALWDRKPGDGPGGTEHLVKAAPQLGIDAVIVIAPQELVI